MTTRGGHLRAWSFKVVIWHVVERTALTRNTPLNDHFSRSPDPPVYNLTQSVQGKPSSVERYNWSFIFLSSSLWHLETFPIISLTYYSYYSILTAWQEAHKYDG